MHLSVKLFLSVWFPSNRNTATWGDSGILVYVSVPLISLMCTQSSQHGWKVYSVNQITTHRWRTSETKARKRWKFLSIKLITRRKTTSRKKNPQKNVPSQTSEKYPLATVISRTSYTMKRLGNFLSQFQTRFIPFSCKILPSVVKFIKHLLNIYYLIYWIDIIKNFLFSVMLPPILLWLSRS